MFIPENKPNSSDIIDPCIAPKYIWVRIALPNILPNKRNEMEIIDDNLPTTLRGNIKKNGLKYSLI